MTAPADTAPIPGAPTIHYHHDLQPLLTPIEQVTPHPDNPRNGDTDVIIESIRINGLYRPLYAQRSTGHLLAGNHTYAALMELGATHAPILWITCDDDTARRIMLIDNRAADLGRYDEHLLLQLLQAEAETGPGLLGTGYTDYDIAALDAALRAADHTPLLYDGPGLADRFVIPPFSVLDARLGAWRERRRSWLALGIRSEQGRRDTQPGGGGTGSLWMKTDVDGRMVQPQAQYRKPGAPVPKGLNIQTPMRDPDLMRKKNAAGAQAMTTTEFAATDAYTAPGYGGLSATGTSVFDPVLCELTYRWFMPPAGRVLDPFAGGSVRGIVAAALGHRYTGIELSAEQVEANREQADSILPRLRGDLPVPTWIVGDSRNLADDSLVDGEDGFDLIFTCPPYADLERYSDDPADLSTMPWDEFRTAYRQIIAAACDRLAPDRFAVWTVADVRAKSGHGAYRGLLAETIDAFRWAGCDHYNEMILVTPLGSLPIRVGSQFSAARKVGKTHQQVLVFVKGDARAASEVCGEVQVSLPEPEPAEDDGGEEVLS